MPLLGESMPIIKVLFFFYCSSYTKVLIKVYFENPVARDLKIVTCCPKDLNRVTWNPFSIEKLKLWIYKLYAYSFVFHSFFGLKWERWGFVFYGSFFYLFINQINDFVSFHFISFFYPHKKNSGLIWIVIRIIFFF